MKPHELQETIQNDKKLTIQEVEDIICELKDDTIEIQNGMLQKKCDTTNKDLWISNYGFYNGERNAFYICLDLLNKVDRQSNSVFEDIKTGLKQAIEYEVESKNKEEDKIDNERFDKALETTLSQSIFRSPFSKWEGKGETK